MIADKGGEYPMLVGIRKVGLYTFALLPLQDILRSAFDRWKSFDARYWFQSGLQKSATTISN